jgi:glycosyltransferase involved in cell wall biosynthesis
MAENRICLNMIVKNESRIIERCIKSVYHLIDTWCIVDTGSTDGTQEIIKELLKDKPGELIEKPWVNFGHNRNEALSLAKKWGEWTLLTDADMVLIDKGFKKEELNLDVCGYDVEQDNNGTRYYNFRILNSSKDWTCIGVTHEYYSPKDGMKQRGALNTLHFNDISDGGSKGDKFTRDIALLEQGLIDEPANHRYMFYLAQSYRDTSQFDKAIEWYQKCSDTSTWDEEKFFSAYMVGWCMGGQNAVSENSYTIEKISEKLLYAWMLRPWRIEPIFQLAMEYKNRKMWQHTYQLLKICASTDYPEQDLLFIAAALYEGISTDEYSVAAYWAGKYDDSSAACQQLLEMGYNPVHSGRIRKNLYYAENAKGTYSQENLQKYLKAKKESVENTYLVL